MVPDHGRPEHLTDEPEYEYGGGFDDETAAFVAALKAKEQHAQGRRVKPSNITVGEFFDEWMTSIKGSIKETTYASYEDYQEWIKPTIWKKKLQKVDVQTLNALYRHLLDEGPDQVAGQQHPHVRVLGRAACGGEEHHPV